jgi:SNF2 family DNA or RNA helicase
MITIKWQYGEFEADDEPGDIFFAFAEGKKYAIRRDITAEKEIKEWICSMHERFPKQKNGYYYLPFAEAEKKQWFVKFYRQLIDKDIPVYGMEQLQHFRYNMNMPVIQIHFDGKGIDWFDLKVTINFGGQQVELADLQKAICNKQTFLLLKDGTIGAIPEEWQQEYGMILRMGKIKNDSLRLSALHHTLLENINDNGAISAKAVTKKFREKWLALQQQKSRLYPVPEAIKAKLRDYQHAGFEWLCLLDEMQWGGCLADDMGLGKTLQVITFLQHTCLQKNDETHLVICPTSLLYNWESELKKFAPGLRYFIYYNNNRNFDAAVFCDHNIVLTTYGCVRSDIDILEKFNFGYIVCDESHVIKNPAAQLSRAVIRLQARNRIALSGTPVQNNTFDLYAQMNFLNPGLLGNREFFKSEFSQPIDKYGDKEKSVQLKKIIYPFLLRRTKEQVAKDLPAKTEITLWCEMEEEQREIYDAIKNYYRQSLLQRIEKDGIGKNAVYILEGLTRLRQACNAPQLLKDFAGSGCTPVKLELLLNELEENTGQHKVLVFSQFTGMLQLVGNALEKDGVPYLYLDGSTKAEQRQMLVQQFQTTDAAKVFLVSLKAGGVGLTLTAADYVYLIDPWWNPAAEQQAIDRTHRIGQQQKVFAYKMICRDTVEEKILALQQKKQMLVKDIISEEAGFVKSLSEDDVKFLFG